MSEPQSNIEKPPLIDALELAFGRGNVRISQPCGDLVDALAKAQGEMEDPVKDKTATIAGDKAKYGYDYADLAGVRQACRKALSSNGIAVLQPPCHTGEGVMTVVTLLMKGEQWIAAELPMPLGGRTPQAIGSCITYGRRFSLKAMCGLADTDDDGEAAARGIPQGPPDPTGPLKPPPDPPKEPAKRAAPKAEKAAPATPAPAEGRMVSRVGEHAGKELSDWPDPYVKEVITVTSKAAHDATIAPEIAADAEKRLAFLYDEVIKRVTARLPNYEEAPLRTMIATLYNQCKDPEAPKDRPHRERHMALLQGELTRRFGGPAKEEKLDG